jgi:hypothetical protein
MNAGPESRIAELMRAADPQHGLNGVRPGPRHTALRDQIMAEGAHRRWRRRHLLSSVRRLVTPAFAAAAAVIVVALVVGVVAVAALSVRNQVASTPKDAAPTLSGEATPLPSVPLPAPGSHATLAPDPTLTWESLHGALRWTDAQGLDYTSLQGFQRVGIVQAWTAEKLDGGTCILLRTDDGSVFDHIGCDTDGAPATVEQALNGTVLRFTLTEEAIDVYVTSP